MPRAHDQFLLSDGDDHDALIRFTTLEAGLWRWLIPNRFAAVVLDAMTGHVTTGGII
jgi:hypothetical protein